MKVQELKTDIGNKRQENITLGRKTIKSGEQGKHNKYSDDNLRRKCKHLILDNLMEFINEIIKQIYKNNIGEGILIKKLFTMNQNQIKNAYIKYNQNFLNKTLGDIFSEDICKRYTNYPPDHNKNLVNKLMNENNIEIKNLFTIIFNLTFKEVINHLKGKEEIIELQGLKDINGILKKYEDEPNYFDVLKCYILNFDIITEKKRPRKSRIQEEEKKEQEI